MPNLEKYDNATLAINGAYEEACRAFSVAKEASNSGLDWALTLGMLLTEKKATLGRGDWIPYCRGQLDFNEREAQHFMYVYEGRDHLEQIRNAVSYLSFRGAIKYLQEAKRVESNTLPPKESHEEEPSPITAIQPESSPAPLVGVEAENCTGHAKPPFQDTDKEESRPTVSETPIRAGHSKNSTRETGDAETTSGSDRRAGPAGSRFENERKKIGTLSSILNTNKEELITLFGSETFESLTGLLIRIEAGLVKGQTRDHPPTLPEIEAYCVEADIEIVWASAFFDYEVGSDWQVGRKYMVEWRAALRDFVRRESGWTAEREDRYERARVQGVKTSAARYEQAIARRQQEARQGDVATAKVEYLSEEEYNARQNGEVA